MAGAGQTEVPTLETAAEQAKANLKGEYKENCKVIPGVGEFAYVIRVVLSGRDATVTFQIPEGYPKSDTTVRVTSKSLTQEQQREVEQIVSKELSDLDDAANLKNVVAKAQDWFEEHIGCEKSIIETKQKKPKSKKKIVKAAEDENERKSSKKPSMKTSDDVIKRIQWDEALPTQNFVVGYLDRFTGLEEKPFSAFSWEDIASVDMFTLAIPRHRIQHFKYRDVKVWDKTQRLDLVFGSVGGPASIIEIVKACDEAAAVKTVTSTKQSLAEPSSHGDDENELELELGSFSRLQMGQAKDTSSEDESDQRPNYFIGVRVQAEDIVNAAQSVQDHMLGKEPRYAPCVIPSPCLHVTLCTVGLDSLDDITRCCDALKACRNKIASVLPKDFALKLKEVRNFYDRVVYARVEPHPAFMNFVEVLKEELIDRGVSVRDQYSFVPHMTLMKTTRPVAREMRTKLVDSSLYAGFKNLCLGEQPVTAIDLCQMGDARRADGFYMSPLHLPLCEE